MIPVAYSARSLLTRKSTTIATIIGIGFVVFVFTAVLMLADGIERALAAGGQPHNAIVLRRGATAEVLSMVSRESARSVSIAAEVDSDESGPLASAEVVVLGVLPREGGGRSNVPIRGVGPRAVRLHPGVTLSEGAWFVPAKNEIVIGRRLEGRIAGAAIGQSIRLGRRTLRVVGVLSAGGGSSESEIWGDSDELLDAFSRTAYGSVIVKLKPGSFADFQKRLDADPRLGLEAHQESAFLGDQSRMMAMFVRLLGSFMAVVFALGAALGAMLTMYGQVAARLGEIGTLRAIGFSRRAVLGAFLLESLLLALAGGLLGTLGALALGRVRFTIFNLTSFAELVFTFEPGAAVVLLGLVFALAIGFFGGFLPARRAARASIVESIRAS
jgi:putative ABC transport system permease protein